MPGVYYPVEFRSLKSKSRILTVMQEYGFSKTSARKRVCQEILRVKEFEISINLLTSAAGIA
jgi:hypothetical protein